MNDASWRGYVSRLGRSAWHLDAATAERLVENIELLLDTDELSDATLRDVLLGVGVGEREADSAAAWIRGVIRA